MSLIWGIAKKSIGSLRFQLAVKALDCNPGFVSSNLTLPTYLKKQSRKRQTKWRAFFNFQTEQIRRQHAHYMREYAAWQFRDRAIELSYKMHHITYEQYKEQKTESRAIMIAEEMQSCANYKAAIAEYKRINRT